VVAVSYVVEIEHESFGFAEQYGVVAIGQSADESRRTGHARHYRARAAIDVITLHERDVRAADVTSADDVGVTSVYNGCG